MPAADPLPFAYPVEITHLVVSPLHRYEGRPSDGPLPAVGVESVDEVEVRAGLGIVGDRYFAHRAHRDAAVTVFGLDALAHVAETLGIDERMLDPLAARRNIVLRALDPAHPISVDRLVRQRFSLEPLEAGAVTFDGNRPANPCAWMNEVLAPGAHRALRGRGGVRATPTTDGVLRLGRAILRTSEPITEQGTEPTTAPIRAALGERPDAPR